MLDDIDRVILRILLSNAKTSQGEIAEQVGIKAPSVNERIRKLEAKGIIIGYSARVNAEKLEKNLTAFISVFVAGGPRYADETLISDRISVEPAIEECHIVAGEASMLLKARVNTPQELQELITRLRRIEGIANTSTTVVLSTPLDRPIAIE
jgi:Lrp/AsnC family transcriptional regulator, leucine-responsive regulatory protein